MKGRYSIKKITNLLLASGLAMAFLPMKAEAQNPQFPLTTPLFLPLALTIVQYSASSFDAARDLKAGDVIHSSTLGH